MDRAPSCPFNHAAPAQCPVHEADDAVAVRVAPGDLLVLPFHRRTIVQYATEADGARTLHLYYDDKHISFDDPTLFAFGEALAKQERFVALDATGWGDGYAWEHVGLLLDHLVAEEVLVPADQTTPPPALRRDGVVPSPLPPAPCDRPRSWAELADITATLTGHAVDPGHLELVVPVFRVAHIAVDGDGRQVGEANVFPRALRVDVPTEWRVSNLPGTRFQVDRPMNMTAMKAMRQHWPQMMGALLRIRTAFLARFPEALNGWTVGHLERLATAVLAVPTYQVARGAVANGALHPALSNMFRVTDGLRMVMHQMLFVPVGEPTLPPTAPMDVDTILAYAERNYSFHSETGVCAGPQAMVREFLQVLVEGTAATDYGAVALDPAVLAALDEVEPAIDYALLGLQAYAAMFSLWPAMTRAYDALGALAERWGGQNRPALAAFQARLAQHRATLEQTTFLGAEALRLDRDAVYADMFRACAEGLGDNPAEADLPAALAGHRTTGAMTLEPTLRFLASRRLGDRGAPPEGFADTFVEIAAGFLRRTQAVLAVASQVQNRINRHLGRAPAARAFSAADADVHNLLQGAEIRRLPFLVTELGDILGAHIQIDPSEIALRLPHGMSAA